MLSSQLPSVRPTKWLTYRGRWLASSITHYIGAISVPIAVDITDSFKIKILDELKPKLVIDDCSHFISSSHDVKSEMEDLVLNIEENNLSDIVFTSGTTGDQKGVP